jgi:hypothetical protein
MPAAAGSAAGASLAVDARAGYGVPLEFRIVTEDRLLQLA